MKQRLVGTAVSLAIVGTIAVGCAPSAVAPDPPLADQFGHVHGLAGGPASGEWFVATHNGLYLVDEGGETTGPIGDHAFDVMGFALSGQTLFASGHPGPNTPSDWGSPNLGIIRSDDRGESWEPVALSGIEDFHVLTAGPDSVLYGIGSTSPGLRTGTDNGKTWTEGVTLPAADLAVTHDGRLYAATEAGLQVSENADATFTPVDSAPLLYLLEALPGGGLVGVDTAGTLWRMSPDARWEQVVTAEGMVQALGTDQDGTILIVDDRGIVRIDGTQTIVVRPIR